MTSSRFHDIPKRDLHFDFSKVDLLRWHPNGPHNNHYFNVQSLLFPEGERFFIRSVRYFRDQVGDPALQKQVAGFIAQEAIHGREHDRYNEALKSADYPVEVMERAASRLLWLTEKLTPPKGRLAMTAALEHLTAIGAEDLLTDDRILDGADPEMAKLWRWHAMEETEHKAVAFDVYRQVAGNGFVAWARLCWSMLSVSIGMTLMTWIFMLRVTIKDGSILNLRGWLALFHALWITPGGLRKQFPRYWQFFKPGFHPWQIDNYHQIERWQSHYADDTATETARR